MNNCGRRRKVIFTPSLKKVHFIHSPNFRVKNDFFQQKVTHLCSIILLRALLSIYKEGVPYLIHIIIQPLYSCYIVNLVGLGHPKLTQWLLLHSFFSKGGFLIWEASSIRATTRCKRENDGENRTVFPTSSMSTEHCACSFIVHETTFTHVLIGACLIFIVRSTYLG